MPVRPEKSRRFPAHTFPSSNSFIVNHSSTDINDKNASKTSNLEQCLSKESTDKSTILDETLSVRAYPSDTINQMPLILDLHDQVRWCVEAIGNLFNTITEINMTIQEMIEERREQQLCLSRTETSQNL